MLVLAGGGLSITGALVVYGALTGRLAAMMAAIFKPTDLQVGLGPVAATPDHAGRDAAGNLVPYYDGTPGHQLPSIPGFTPSKPAPGPGKIDGTPGHRLPSIPGVTP
jgi:hypothetical protein